MEVIESLIKKNDFIENGCWRKKHYLVNEEIVTEGDANKTIYYITRGAVRVLGTIAVNDYKRMRPGVCDLAAGEIFGELSLFDQAPRSATVVCIEDCDVVEIDGEKLLSYLQNNTDIGYEFMNNLMLLMVKRLRNSNQKIFSLFSWGLKAHQIDAHIV